MPALFKGFLEHIFRPGFAMKYKKQGFPKRLLAGRSTRIVVTMGMPVPLYRWYFGAYGVRGFERSMLSFAGIKPIRESFYGLAFSNEKKRPRWIEDMRSYGARGSNYELSPSHSRSDAQDTASFRLRLGDWKHTMSALGQKQTFAGRGAVMSSRRTSTRVLLNLISNGFYAAAKRSGHFAVQSASPRYLKQTSAVHKRMSALGQ